MKGTADEAESRAAPGKCCGYQPGADDCALLELCNVQGTFGTITPRDVFRVFLSDRCSTIEELEKVEPTVFKQLIAHVTATLQQEHGGLYRAQSEGESSCLRSWLCRDSAMAGSDMCVACSWLPRNQPMRTASSAMMTR